MGLSTVGSVSVQSYAVDSNNNTYCKGLLEILNEMLYAKHPARCLTQSRCSKKKILFLLMIEFLVVRNTVLFISLVSTPFSAKPGTKKDNKYMISECVHDLNID